MYGPDRKVRFFFLLIVTTPKTEGSGDLTKMNKRNRGKETEVTEIK